MDAAKLITGEEHFAPALSSAWNELRSQMRYGRMPSGGQPTSAAASASRSVETGTAIAEAPDEKLQHRFSDEQKRMQRELPHAAPEVVDAAAAASLARTEAHQAKARQEATPFDARTRSEYREHATAATVFEQDLRSAAEDRGYIERPKALGGRQLIEPRADAGKIAILPDDAVLHEARTFRGRVEMLPVSSESPLSNEELNARATDWRAVAKGGAMTMEHEQYLRFVRERVPEAHRLGARGAADLVASDLEELQTIRRRPEHVKYMEVTHQDGSYEQGLVVQEAPNRWTREGAWRRMDNQNRLQAETRYAGGLLDGEFTDYGPDQLPRLRGRYRDGLRQGEQVHFNDQGHEVSRALFENGKALRHFVREEVDADASPVRAQARDR